MVSDMVDMEDIEAMADIMVDIEDTVDMGTTDKQKSSELYLILQRF